MEPDNNYLYELVMRYDRIYSLMYSPTRIGDRSLSDQIIDIRTVDLCWYNDKTGFWYRWGWPGPDVNLYTAETYGKGWALTKEEIFRAWGESEETDR